MKKSVRIFGMVFASIWVMLTTETVYGAQSGGKETTETSRRGIQEAKGIGQEIHDHVKDILDKNDDHKGIGHEIHDDVDDIIVSRS